MKDRIKQIMESRHMTQQVFADFIGTTPATLSGIFNDRTRPTINIVESIKKKFPDISLDWLMFGQGEMFNTPVTSTSVAEPSLFDDSTKVVDTSASIHHTPTAPSPSVQGAENSRQSLDIQEGVKQTLKETIREELKIFDSKKRRVCEIRVFYDDGSYDSFLPASSNR